MKPLLFVCVLGSVTLASEVPEANRELVRAAVKKGDAAFDSGKFDLAIQYYEAAHRVQPIPELLFNVAQAHRLRGDRENALAQYRAYLLVASPNSMATRAQAEAYVQQLLQEIEAAALPPLELSGSSTPTRPPPVREGEPRRLWALFGTGAGFLAAGIAFAAAGGALTNAADTSESGQRNERIGIALLSVGAVVGVAGITMSALGLQRWKLKR